MEPLPIDPIRQAIICGEFDRAQLLWNQCAARLNGELSAGHLSADMLSEVNAFVAWSRGVVLCERAHLLDQLNSLHVAGEYEQGVPPPEHCLVEASF